MGRTSQDGIGKNGETLLRLSRVSVMMSREEEDFEEDSEEEEVLFW